ncbi:DUF4259 domain-containing protein [bacterium]|nr:DUF4259 domain-containing protein [bacterium]
MGTWGTGPFDDDQALDWLGDATDSGLSEAVPDFLDEWEEEAREDFLDSYFGANALAVAETCAYRLGKPVPYLSEDEDYGPKLAADPFVPDAAVVRRLIALLETSLGPKSAIVMEDTWGELSDRDEWRANAEATRDWLKNWLLGK